jgi:hypothetical protein
MLEEKEKAAEAFQKALEYAASPDSSTQEKKEVIEFLKKNLSQCKGDEKSLIISAIKKISLSCDDELKKYCEEIIAQ